MWKRSFVATTVALGGSVDDALAALGASAADPTLAEVASKLRAPRRLARATALATMIGDVVFAIEEARLR